MRAVSLICLLAVGVAACSSQSDSGTDGGAGTTSTGGASGETGGSAGAGGPAGGGTAAGSGGAESGGAAPVAGAGGTGPTAGGGGAAGSGRAGATSCVYDEMAGTCTGPASACCPMKGIWVKLVPSTGCCTELPDPNAKKVLACGPTVPPDDTGMGCVGTASLGCYSTDQPDGTALLALVESENWNVTNLGPGFHVCTNAQKGAFSPLISKLKPNVEVCP